MRRNYLGAIIPVALFGCWQLVGSVPAWQRDTVSRPSAIFLALWEGLVDGSILLATWQTFEAALLGFALAAVIGVAAGVAIGLMPRVGRIVGPSIDLMRPVPSVALIPLTLMIYGFGVRMEAAVVAFACLWPVLIVTIAAVRGIEPGLLEVARVLRMSVSERTAKIVLPAALGRIAVGLQLALSIALVVAVTVEIVLNPRGLGHGMMSAQQAMRFDQMYAQLLWVGLVGWGVSYLSAKALAAWSPAAQAAAKGRA